MNNYHEFKVGDWLEDRAFQNWVYLGESNHYWIDYIEKTPHQAADINQAREILLAIRGESEFISPREVTLRVAEILSTVSDQGENHRNLWRGKRWLLAASILLLIGLGLRNFYTKSIHAKLEPYYAMVEKPDGSRLIQVSNKSDGVKTVNLPDGSSIILKKNARIAYPRHFDLDKREVFMLGEVFFEVRKNPEQPFYVYTGEMSTLR